MSTLTTSSFAATVDGRDFAVDGSFDVLNPATGLVIGQAPAVTAAQLDDVYRSAEAAYRSWRMDDAFRCESLRRAASALEASVEALAMLLTAEQGKPLAEARTEVGSTVDWLRYYAGLEMPTTVVRDDEGGYEAVVSRPIGVVAAITPWNFPVSLAMWKIAPALRAGNTVVMKPSPYTPLATLEMARILRGVLPDGVLNVITGPDPLGAALVSHPTPRKISFTGSTTVGKRVAVAAGEDLKRVTLELGGNDPAIVLRDADVAAIAPTLFWGAFYNNGQICLAVKRVYAHRDIHHDLVEALGEIARNAVVGDGSVSGSQLGPLNNRPQFERVGELVDDAVAHGARVVSGGRALEGDGYFYSPTILDQVSDGIRIVDEEQFGPVLPVMSFDDESDAIERANNSEYGLTASVWSADSERAYAVAAQIDSGQVAINGHGRAAVLHLPFGGHKWSGVGLENGPWGLESFTQKQAIAGPARRR